MKRSTLFWLVICAALLTFGIVTFLYTNLTIVFYRAFDVTLEVSEDTAGFNVEPDNLYFGIVPAGGTSTREVFLESYFPYPVTVDVSLIGEIRDHVKQKEWRMVLETNDSASINVTAISGQDSAGDKYSGKMIIIFRRLWGR